MNKTNFLKYLEQRDPELYEQMLNEGIHDIIGKGVDYIQKKNQEYFPDQIRKDGKWINKPAEPQDASQPQDALATQSQPTTAVNNNFLKSFKILYRAVNGNEINDSEIDNLGMDKIIKYYDTLKKIPTFDKFNELYRQYSGRDFADPKKWYKNTFKKRIESYETLKNKVAKGFKSKSYNSDDDFVPDFSDFNTSIGKFGNGKDSAYEHYNQTFKNWFDQRLTLEGDREDAFATNNDRICQAVQRIKQQIENMKKQGAKPEAINAMIIRHDDIATRCKKVPVKQ